MKVNELLKIKKRILFFGFSLFSLTFSLCSSMNLIQGEKRNDSRISKRLRVRFVDNYGHVIRMYASSTSKKNDLVAIKGKVESKIGLETKLNQNILSVPLPIST